MFHLNKTGVVHTLLALALLALAAPATADWSRHGDHLYQKGDHRLDWEQARSACEAEGAMLASAHSPAENAFLADLCFADCKADGTCNYLSDCWIGLNDRASEGSYEWVDGTPHDWSPPHFTWNRPERDCFVLEGHYNDGAWEGDFCTNNPDRLTERKHYLCQKPAAVAATACSEEPPASMARHTYWRSDVNMTAHETGRFLPVLDAAGADPRWQVVARRGRPLRVSSGEVSAHRVELRHCTAPGAPATGWTVADGQIELPADLPIGVYEVTAPAELAGQQVIVLFDAANPAAPEYFGGDPGTTGEQQIADERDFWVHGTTGGDLTTVQGAIQLSYWPIDPYEPEVLAAILSLLRTGAGVAGSVDAAAFLGDPWRVMRAFTWLLHDRDPDHQGIAHAQWESGAPCPNDDERFCKGTGELYGAKAWVSRWNENGRRAIWPANCQDLAGLYCTAARALGVACRMVSGARVAQDEYPGDRVLDVRDAGRLGEDENGVRTENQRTHGNNSLWGNHTWSEVFLSRSPFPGAAGWHVAEPTPSVVSEGRHQLGPIPLSRVEGNDSQSPHGRPALGREVGYFVSQSKGYVWLGRGLARQGFGDAVDALVPSRLDDVSVDLSFRQWHAGGMRPESFACLLAQGLTLDGYLAADLEQIDPARPQGHLMTLSPSCQAEPERQWDFGLQLFKWVPLSFSGDGIAECVRPVTRRYKTHPTQGPFEGGSEPKPGFVLLRERLDCGPTAN